MVLPIVAYGDPVLKRKGKNIPEDFENLDEFVQNMWDTMYNANGVGLAAPQVGRSIRLFVADPSAFVESEDFSEEEKEDLKRAKQVYINPVIPERAGDDYSFSEGCLSIPGIQEDVFRPEEITIEYYDTNFKKHTDTFGGPAARVIQHEYDHIEGILFTDKLSSLKRQLIKNKLKNITKGKVDVDYRMLYPKVKKLR